jgi:hypothetical protein
VRLGRHANAEVHVRLGVLDLSTRTDDAYALALGNLGADADADGSEMEERDRVPVFGANRHAEPRVRQRPGERNHTTRGCAHVGTRGRPDIHATVLAAKVRIVISQETPEDWAVDRPAPGPGPGGEGERSRHCDHDRRRSVANFENHEPGTVTGWSAVVKFGYREGR